MIAIGEERAIRRRGGNTVGEAGFLAIGQFGLGGRDEVGRRAAVFISFDIVSRSPARGDCYRHAVGLD